MLPKYLKDSTFSSCFWSIVIFNGNAYKHQIYKCILDFCILFGCCEIFRILKKFVLSVAVPDTQLVPDGGYAVVHDISFYTAVSIDVEQDEMFSHTLCPRVSGNYCLLPRKLPSRTSSWLHEWRVRFRRKGFLIVFSLFLGFSGQLKLPLIVRKLSPKFSISRNLNSQHAVF
jgi:hypothetical protein